MRFSELVIVGAAQAVVPDSLRIRALMLAPEGRLGRIPLSSILLALFEVPHDAYSLTILGLTRERVHWRRKVYGVQLTIPASQSTPTAQKIGHARGALGRARPPGAADALGLARRVRAGRGGEPPTRACNLRGQFARSRGARRRGCSHGGDCIRGELAACTLGRAREPSNPSKGGVSGCDLLEILIPA